MRKNPVYSAMIEEARHWPGVEHWTEYGGRHVKVHFRYAGVSRFLPTSISPSDNRAALNQLTHMKRLLREIGAKRQS